MSQNNALVTAKKIVKIFLGTPLTLISFYFIFTFLWTSRSEIVSTLNQANYTLLLLGLLFLWVFYLIKNIAWYKILRTLGAQEVSTPQIFYLLSFAETKRYIPGSILAFAARIQSLKKIGVENKITIKAITVESILMILSSAILSIPGLLFILPRLSKAFPEYSQYFSQSTLALVVLTITTIFGIVLFILNRYKKFRFPLDHISKYFDIFMLSALSWIFFGIGNYLVASSLHVLDPKFLLEFSSFFVLAWLVGYLSIVTPMGLGVREGVLLIGLAPFAPLSITSLIAIISRIALMASEFVFLLFSYVIYKTKNIHKAWISISQNWQFVLLWILIVAYSIYFSFVSITKYHNFFMGKFDLGNMVQTVWNTSQGRIFQLTNPDGAETISRLGVHADFILILISPLFFIWSDPRMLLLLQTIVIALGAYFVYMIASTVLKNKTVSIVFASVYLLNPLLQKQNLYDFHAVALATTFLLAMWYFFIQKKMFLMILFLLLAVLTKENVYLITAIFGLFLIYKKHFKLGSLLTIACIIIFLALMKVFIPEARDGDHFAVKFLGNFGDSLGRALFRIVSDPVYTVSVFFAHKGFSYLTMLLLPVGFFPISAPLYMIFAAPDITKNVLADNPNFRSSYYQYNAEIIPFLIISSLYGFKYVQKKIPSKILMYYLLGSSIIGVYMYGALPFGKRPYTDIYTNPRANASEISIYLKTIDKSKSVSATNNLGSQLSQREHIYVYPNGADKADFIMFLNTDWYDPIDELNQKVKELTLDDDYVVAYQVGQFIAFEKIQK